MKKILLAGLVLLTNALVAKAVSLPDSITVQNDLNSNPLYILGIATTNDAQIIQMQIMKKNDGKPFPWTKNSNFSGKNWALYALDAKEGNLYTYPGGSDAFIINKNSTPTTKGFLHDGLPSPNLTVYNGLSHPIYIIGATSDGQTTTLEIFEEIPTITNNELKLGWNISNNIHENGKAWGLYMIDPSTNAYKNYPQEGYTNWNISDFSRRR